MEDMTLKTNEILSKFKNNELTLEQTKKLLDQPLDYATIDYDRKKEQAIMKLSMVQEKQRNKSLVLFQIC